MKYLKLLCLLLFITSPSFADDWKFITSEDGINVYGKKAANGVMPFKASAFINTDAQKLVAILKDHKNKPRWAPKLDRVKMHLQLSDNEYIFSEYYRTPWPASDREFLLKGRIDKVGKSYVLKAHSVDNLPQFHKLASDDHVQATVKYINIVLTEVEPNKTEIQFEFYGNMNGWMPTWLMNLIQKKWPLRFIQGLRKFSANQQIEVAAKK